VLENALDEHKETILDFRTLLHRYVKCPTVFICRFCY